MKNEHSSPHQTHFDGGGEMGELTRLHDWVKTPLGPPDAWPQSLKTILSIILKSPFPMFLWWGPELLCFYNDAYRPSLGNSGKHPSILGMPAQKAWSEIWPTIQPLIDRVLQHGESIWSEDQLIPIFRNGKMEDVYWTFSYSPALDDDGQVAGVLVTCTETTENVRTLNVLQNINEKLAVSNEELVSTNEELLSTQAEMQRLIDQLEISENMYRNEKHRLERFFMQAPAGICVLDGPWFVFELVNPLYQQFFPGRELLGRSLLEALPELSSTPIFDILSKVYRSEKTFEGRQMLVPLARTDGGPIEDRYFDFIYQARFDNDGRTDGILVFVIEVTETVLKEAIIKQGAMKNAQLAAIVSSSEDTIVSKTLEGIITTWNTAAEKMFGYAATEAIGKHISILIPEALLQEEEYIINQIKQGNKVDHFETTRVAKNGRLVPISLTISPITNEYGTIIGASKIARDISAKKEAQETAARLYEQVKMLNDKKDEFIGVASHELRTPLTTINGYMQILNRIHTDPNSKKFIDKSLQQLNKLTSLVNDLLDVSKIEAGKLPLNTSSFDLNDLVEDAIELIQHATNKFIIYLKPNAEKCLIVADKQRIEQVMVNLLTNAIKYSPKADKVEVTVLCTKTEATVSVKDYGLGIPGDKLNDIFTRFYRIDDSSPTVSGLGIGLYLSNEIIGRHKGKLWAESEPGKGSTFHFKLPIIK